MRNLEYLSTGYMGSNRIHSLMDRKKLLDFMKMTPTVNPPEASRVGPSPISGVLAFGIEGSPFLVALILFLLPLSGAGVGSAWAVVGAAVVVVVVVPDLGGDPPVALTTLCRARGAGMISMEFSAACHGRSH